MPTIRDIMSKDVQRIGYEKSVLSAAMLMVNKHIGCLVVMSGNRAVGMLTERDILSKVLCKRSDPVHTLVADTMNSPIITIDPLLSVNEAAKKMNKNKIKKLVVVSNNTMVGIITAADIVRTAPDSYNEFIKKWIEPRWVTSSYEP